jgi:iron(III) transport system ATP-binding protein
VREEIRELQQKLELTSVYVTHDQGEALAVSDHIIVMRNAEIAQAGAPRELYDAPLDPFVADFIGDANLVEAEIVAVNGELATVRIGPLTRELPHRGLAPGPAHVALRPETIRLVPQRQDDAIEGEVLKATYLGSHMEYTVTTALAELFVVDPHVERALPPGTAVSVIPGARGITLVREA